MVKKFKKQISSLGLLKFDNWSHVKFIQWSILTKLYLIHVFPDKKNDYLRGMYVSMFDDAVKQMPKSRWYTKSEENLVDEVRLAKDWLQATLKAFIEMMELEEESIRWGGSKTKISIDNKQFNNQKVSITQIMKNIITEVEKVTDDKSIIEESKNKTQQLEDELKKPVNKSNRETIKGIIKWFADLWKDVLIAVLPALLKYYWVWE